MKKDELVKYSLSKISQLDKMLNDNSKNKKLFINKYSLNFKICDFINKIYTSKLFVIMVMFIAFLSYFLIQIAWISILISLGLIALINMIMLMTVKLLLPNKKYYNVISNYNLESKELLLKRNTYINIYNYLEKGDSAIIDNIKLKINNKVAYNYEDILNTTWLNEDEYASYFVKSMHNKENIMIKDIKQQIELEISNPSDNLNISLEQLQKIQSAL